MLNSDRQKALRALLTSRETDVDCCRHVEAACHAASRTEDDYWDNVRRAAHNLLNPSTSAQVVSEPDDQLTHGTVVATVETERRARNLRFEQMLQEKYEALDDAVFKTVVRCNRCKSTDVSWEEKQTRSADEGATLFVVCNSCNNRWVIR